MRIRVTSIGIFAAVCLALTGCTSSDSTEAEDAPAASAPGTGASEPDTTQPSPTPSLDQEDIANRCTAEIAEVAPSWEEWSFNPGGWQDDPRTPEVCLGLADETNPPRGNRAFMSALTAGLELADDPRANQ